MATTDSPLKLLCSAFITDFATWLLQTEVREARPLNVELPSELLAVDQVFLVTLADGRTLLLHAVPGQRPRWPRDTDVAVSGDTPVADAGGRAPGHGPPGTFSTRRTDAYRDARGRVVRSRCAPAQRARR